MLWTLALINVALKERRKGLLVRQRCPCKNLESVSSMYYIDVCNEYRLYSHSGQVRVDS